MTKKKAETHQADDRAPRPHAVTVWLAMGSIVVSLTALVIALRSSGTANDSLRISQQPYLSVRTNVLTVRGMRMFQNPSGVKPADNSPPVVLGRSNDEGSIDLRQAQGDLAIHLEFEVENSGNTPAAIEELVLSFKMPRGWELTVGWTSDGVRLTKGSRRASIAMDAVNPRKSVQRAITIGLGLTDDARIEFLGKRAETSINGVPPASLRRAMPADDVS